jgi:hypothetical protein
VPGEFYDTLLGREETPFRLGQPLGLVDVIFVLAGRPERKRYGWELFRRGVAPMLLLSVERSEARFLKARVGLPTDGGIGRYLPISPEQGNHLFLWCEQNRMRPEVVRLPELNTFGEIAALCTLIHRYGFRRVLIISTGIHLRRIRYAVRQLLGPTQARITYTGLPRKIFGPRYNHWPAPGQALWAALSEWIKLVGYQLKYGVLRWHRRYPNVRNQTTNLSR